MAQADGAFCTSQLWYFGSLDSTSFSSQPNQPSCESPKENTPLKTNMTLENSHFQSSSNGGFSTVMLVFGGIYQRKSWCGFCNVIARRKKSHISKNMGWFVKKVTVTFGPKNHEK